MSMTRRRLLDDTYKKTASGNPVIARTVARMNPDLKVYGWTEQDTYSGNNLLNFTDTEQIINGMTFHVKKSVLTVTGTTTEFTSTAGEIYYMLPITVGTFYLSMRSSSMEYISNPKLEAWVIDADDTEHFYGNGAFSLNGTEKSCRVYFGIPEGNTFNGDKFYPMINVGSVPLPWEPYTGGKPAPNPDYPIPWHNAGEVMTTGAQLLDTIGIESNGTVWIERLNDGSVLVNAPTNSDSYYLTLAKEISLPNGTYYATTGRSDVRLVIIMTVQGVDDYEYALNQSFTVDDTVTLIQWRLQINPNTASVENKIVYPMMNVGSVPLPWEPYTNGVPTVNPYKGEISVTIRGGNLFDISQIGNAIDITVDGDTMNLHVYANSTGIVFDGNVYRGKTLTTSRILIDGSGAIPGSIRLIDEKQDSYVLCDGGDGYKYGTLTIPDDAGDNLELYIYGSNDGEEIKATVSQLMICEGSTAFPYEPYRTPQTVLLTSDRPLTKWDRIEKKNGLWGVVRKSAEIVLDGSEDEKFSIYEMPDEGKSFAITLNDSVGGYQTSLCDKYRNVDSAWTSYHKGEYAIYSDHSNVTNTTRYFRPPSAEIETIEQWKTWLQSNPLTLLYETEEETFEPFDVSQQEILNAIHTYNPSTSVFNWQNCNMDFTYKTRKSVENYE